MPEPTENQDPATESQLDADPAGGSLDADGGTPDSGEAATDAGGTQEPMVDLGGEKVPISTVNRWKQQVQSTQGIAADNERLRRELEMRTYQQPVQPQQVGEPEPTMENLIAQVRAGNEIYDPTVLVRAIANREEQQRQQEIAKTFHENQSSLQELASKNPQIVQGHEKYNPTFAKEFWDRVLQVTGGRVENLLTMPKAQFAMLTDAFLEKAKVASGVAQIEWREAEKRRDEEARKLSLQSPGGSAVPGGAAPSNEGFDQMIERLKREEAGAR